MNIFILEDDDFRISHFKDIFKDHKLDIVKTSDEALKKIGKIKFDLIFLDHDLGGLQMLISTGTFDTGYRVAVELGSPTCLNRKTPVIIHSFNPAGADNMYQALGEDRIKIKKEFGSFTGDILYNLS